MTDILLITIIISFTTLGARIITDDEMIGFPIRKFALRFGLLGKPIITCCVCMPSVWGVGIHFLIGATLWWYIPLEILSACFINAFLWKAYDKYNQ